MYKATEGNPDNQGFVQQQESEFKATTKMMTGLKKVHVYNLTDDICRAAKQGRGILFLLI